MALTHFDTQSHAPEVKGSPGNSPCVPPPWAAMIPSEQWAIYARAFTAIRATGLRFMIGGGFAMANYTQRWRNTKDIDFYVLPHDRQKAIEALIQAGFADYYSQFPYDRGWIYRSTAEGMIVDVIWSMANRRAQMDEGWFDRAPTLCIEGETFQVLPAEELLWAKLYVLQHDHCDWPDVLNLLYTHGSQLDWEHLFKRLDEDRLLLKAVATLFDWLFPDRSQALPKAARAQLGLPEPEEAPPRDPLFRVKLLDSRNWFVGSLPMDKPLEI